MKSITNLTGLISDYPLLTNNKKTDSIMLKLHPIEGTLDKGTGVICKGKLANVVLEYYKSNTVIEVTGFTTSVKKGDFPGEMPESVIEASKIKFLYIQKAKERIAV